LAFKKGKICIYFLTFNLCWDFLNNCILLKSTLIESQLFLQKILLSKLASRKS
jgi:hypothetical protein